MYPKVLVSPEDDPVLHDIGSMLLEKNRLYFHRRHQKKRGFTDEGCRLAIDQLRLKIYTMSIGVVVDELQMAAPQYVLEVAHGGTLHSALAFPDALVVGVDADIRAFGVEVNSLPVQDMQTYHRAFRDRLGIAAGDLALVSQSVLGYRRGVADAHLLPFPDDSFDISLVSFAPEDFRAEMVRVTRPGGYLLCVEELSRCYRKSGREFCRRERGWKRVRGARASTTSRIKRMEELCTWSAYICIDEVPLHHARTGMAVDVFRKKAS